MRSAALLRVRSAPELVSEPAMVMAPVLVVMALEPLVLRPSKLRVPVRSLTLSMLRALLLARARLLAVEPATLLMAVRRGAEVLPTSPSS